MPTADWAVGPGGGFPAGKGPQLPGSNPPQPVSVTIELFCVTHRGAGWSLCAGKRAELEAFCEKTLQAQACGSKPSRCSRTNGWRVRWRLGRSVARTQPCWVRHPGVEAEQPEAVTALHPGVSPGPPCLAASGQSASLPAAPSLR